MRRYGGRISVEKTDVEHHDEPIGHCFVCGAFAHHKIKPLAVGKGSIDKTVKFAESNKPILLCTLHMARMFKLPASRFKKRKKVVEQKPNVEQKEQVIFLRRHMQEPMEIEGQRLICYQARQQIIDGTPLVLFFSLYHTWSENQRGNLKPAFVVTVTAVDHKSKWSMPWVSRFLGRGYIVGTMEDAKAFFASKFGEKFKGLRFEIEATEFLNEVGLLDINYTD